MTGLPRGAWILLLLVLCLLPAAGPVALPETPPHSEEPERARGEEEQHRETRLVRRPERARGSKSFPPPPAPAAPPRPDAALHAFPDRLPELTARRHSRSPAA